MVAAPRGVSSARNPHEMALSSPDHGALDLLERNLVRIHGLSVEADTTLVDDAAPVARGLPEDVGEELWHVDDLARVNVVLDLFWRDLLDLFWRFTLPDHAREVFLPAVRSIGIVVELDDSARQRELRLHRITPRRFAVESQSPPLVERGVRDGHDFPEHLLGRVIKSDVVALGFRHLVHTVGAHQELVRDHRLRREPVVMHNFSAHQQVVELVGATYLDVRLDSNGVVPLREGVEQLRDRNRLAGVEPLRKVVAFEEPRDRAGAREADELGVVELSEPLAVEANLR